MSLDSTNRRLAVSGAQTVNDFAFNLVLRADDGRGNVLDSPPFNVTVIPYENESPASGTAQGADVWDMTLNAKMAEYYAPQGPSQDGAMGMWVYRGRDAVDGNPLTPDSWALTVANVSSPSPQWISMYTPMYGGFMRPVSDEQFGNVHFLLPG